ncbi:hypothetical protein N7489_002964 [Penicillium chrysogenum]|jgi:hypothetical protein|uniref:Aminoglycoside phosphotransferase domain-containing protein n=1 Tax=Penicillium chrysogenum TaxID=5076 RepID=A0ABQ8W789_PENCH|nr:uncharacterized protein N7489_002964 [Penicillium chrysogenum]KAJ5252554.1 hypothetical protein N7489_002964 [Penicillium chrysogenum]KAJ5259793.1 hypothetical protein N7505_009174 [Penicillium chrysogenum]KAJ6142341.1 hypothetical protein N7497_011440 [Penicillium chrysogenum]
MEDHIKESIKQVDKNTWIIGSLILHSSSGRSDTSSWYDSTDNISYTLTNAPAPPPPAVPLIAKSPKILLVYQAGNSSAVWSIGTSAFCKVKLRVEGATSEAATLAFVQEQKPYFKTPSILHQAEDNSRSYLFLGRVPGRTLADAWPTLDETWKHYYVEAVVKVCETLEGWKGHALGGVDGKGIPEEYLVKLGAGTKDFRPEKLTEVCQLMGMDCSTFVFYHADLGPGNIIVEDVPKAGTVGIIDWEIAGYFPRGWIRTKFRISSGLDLPNPGVNESYWWRSEVQKLLEKHGFEDHVAEWQSWWY